MNDRIKKIQAFSIKKYSGLPGNITPGTDKREGRNNAIQSGESKHHAFLAGRK